MTIPPTVGCIMWPARYCSTSGTASPNNVAAAENGILGPSQWQYLAPWHGSVVNSTTVNYAAGQAQMDRELQMAYDAGIDYFVYDYYPDSTTWPHFGGRALWAGIHNALQYHLASPNKNLVKFALAVILDDVDIPYTGGVTAGAQNSHTMLAATWTTVCNQLVSFMQMSNYQTANVPGLGTNCPILYLFGSGAFAALGGTASNITTLNSIASTAGLNTTNSNAPYIGYMGVQTSDALSGASSLGCNFVTNYCISPASGSSAISVASYDATHQSVWSSWVTANSLGIVPFLAIGWNNDSRVANGYWAGQIPPYSQSYQQHTVLHTPADLANRAVNMLTYFNAHTNLWNNNHVLLASWDEFSEDGNALCPNSGDLGMNAQLVAQALGKQRSRGKSLKSRGIAINSR